MSSEGSAESAVARVALAFAEALVRRDWSIAHTMLAPSLRDGWQPAELEREYCEMTSYWDRPAESVELASADSQRAYVAIKSSSEQFGAVQEAVDVRVVREGDRWLIDDIVWGRP
jgi:hypothetical protein